MSEPGRATLGRDPGRNRARVGAPSRARADERSPKPGRDTLAPPSTPPATPGRELAAWKEELKNLIAGLCARELARTREWLERAGIPKATRVAQREAYNLLRAHGVIDIRGRGGIRVGESGSADHIPCPFTREEEVKLHAYYATEVLKTSLQDYLRECISRGEITPDEAWAILGEAGGAGLVVDSADGAPAGAA